MSEQSIEFDIYSEESDRFLPRLDDTLLANILANRERSCWEWGAGQLQLGLARLLPLFMRRKEIKTKFVDLVDLPDHWDQGPDVPGWSEWYKALWGQQREEERESPLTAAKLRKTALGRAVLRLLGASPKNRLRCYRELKRELSAVYRDATEGQYAEEPKRTDQVYVFAKALAKGFKRREAGEFVRMYTDILHDTCEELEGDVPPGLANFLESYDVEARLRSELIVRILRGHAKPEDVRRRGKHVQRDIERAVDTSDTQFDLLDELTRRGIIIDDADMDDVVALFTEYRQQLYISDHYAQATLVSPDLTRFSREMEELTGITDSEEQIDRRKRDRPTITIEELELLRQICVEIGLDQEIIKKLDKLIKKAKIGYLVLDIASVIDVVCISGLAPFLARRAGRSRGEIIAGISCIIVGLAVLGLRSVLSNEIGRMLYSNLQKIMTEIVSSTGSNLGSASDAIMRDIGQMAPMFQPMPWTRMDLGEFRAAILIFAVLAETNLPLALSALMSAPFLVSLIKSVAFQDILEREKELRRAVSDQGSWDQAEKIGREVSRGITAWNMRNQVMSLALLFLSGYGVLEGGEAVALYTWALSMSDTLPYYFQVNSAQWARELWHSFLDEMAQRYLDVIADEATAVDQIRQRERWRRFYRDTAEAPGDVPEQGVYFDISLTAFSSGDEQRVILDKAKLVLEDGLEDGIRGVCVATKGAAKAVAKAIVQRTKRVQGDVFIDGCDILVDQKDHLAQKAKSPVALVGVDRRTIVAAEAAERLFANKFDWRANMPDDWVWTGEAKEEEYDAIWKYYLRDRENTEHQRVYGRLLAFHRQALFKDATLLLEQVGLYDKKLVLELTAPLSDRSTAAEDNADDDESQRQEDNPVLSERAARVFEMLEVLLDTQDAEPLAGPSAQPPKDVPNQAQGDEPAGGENVPQKRCKKTPIVVVLPAIDDIKQVAGMIRKAQTDGRRIIVVTEESPDQNLREQMGNFAFQQVRNGKFVELHPGDRVDLVNGAAVLWHNRLRVMMFPFLESLDNNDLERATAELITLERSSLAPAIPRWAYIKFYLECRRQFDVIKIDEHTQLKNLLRPLRIAVSKVEGSERRRNEYEEDYLINRRSYEIIADLAIRTAQALVQIAVDYPRALDSLSKVIVTARHYIAKAQHTAWHKEEIHPHWAAAIGTRATLPGIEAEIAAIEAQVFVDKTGQAYCNYVGSVAQNLKDLAQDTTLPATLLEELMRMVEKYRLNGNEMS